MLAAAQSRIELGIGMHTILNPNIAAGLKEPMTDIGKRYGIRDRVLSEKHGLF